MHVVKAREAIEQNDKQNAIGNVAKAITLADIINNNSPVYKVQTTIKSESLSYNDSDLVHSRVVPIYSELERIDLLRPLKSAKNEANANKGNSALKVADSDFVVTSVFLDVNRSKQLLESAQKALNEEKMDQADSLLLALEQNVVLSYPAIDLPLVQVRENLALAKIYAEDGKNDKSRELLRAASKSLENYEKAVGEERSKEVATLRNEIESTEKNTSAQGDGLAQTISSWWNRVTDFM